MAGAHTAWPTRTALPNWRDLVRLTDSELARHDLAAINIACATGLPGAEEIDVGYCLYKLDDWADRVKEYTSRLMPQFRRKPHEYENSEAYFRTLALITVLQRDEGVRYNPAKIPEDAPFDASDSFIHGVIQGDGGTCATLPVVYAAVGRRLGYPIKLAATRNEKFGHLFARWESATGERFNIEAVGPGLTTPPDDFFRSGFYNLSAKVEADGCYLQTQTPREELAGFLAGRGWCAEDGRNWRQCVEAWSWAAELAPRNKLALNSLKRTMCEWDMDQRRRKPAGFPIVWLQRETRLFSALPVEVEQDIHGLIATENLLSNPKLESMYWGRMRCGDFGRVPAKIVATFLPSEVCQVELHFN